MAKATAQRSMGRKRLTRTLLKRGQQFAVVGLEDGKIEIHPLIETDGFNEPRPAQYSEHHLTRVADIGGERLTVKDSITLSTYRVELAGETLECECAFDEVDGVWYVKKF